MTSARTLHEQRQEGDEEDQENRLNATLDPVENGNQVVATWLTGENIALGIHLTDGKLLVQSTKVKHCGA